MSSGTSTDANDLPPWIFFALAAFGCATALLFVGQNDEVAGRILLMILMGMTFLVGIAAVHTFHPLFGTRDHRPEAVGGRKRAEFEREKMLALRAIKDLEFDHAMGKLSQEDFVEMSARLRARAARLMAALDTGESYRQQIESDLAKRMRNAEGRGGSAGQAGAVAGNFCTQCGTKNDQDARFCKSCGHKL